MTALLIPISNQPRRRSRPLRLARSLALATLLGLTLTIATIWAQALLLKPQTWPPGTELVGKNLGWPWTPPEGWPEGANSIRANFVGSYTYMHAPREDRFAADGSSVWVVGKPHRLDGFELYCDLSTDRWMTEQRYGWPFAAMHRVPEIMGFEHFSPNSKSHPHDLNTLSHRLRTGLKLHPNWPEVPLAPVWPGFALHAAFWTLTALAAHHAFITLRTRRRQRLGECTRCRYPIAHLPRCPECGTPTPTPLAESNSPNP